MKGWIFRILAAGSLLLCMAVLALWMTSRHRTFWFYRITLKTSRSLIITSQGIELSETLLLGGSSNATPEQGSRFGDGFYSGAPGSVATFAYNHPTWVNKGFRFGGLWCAKGDETSWWSSVPFGRSRVLVVPFWLPSGLFSMTPIAWAMAARSRRRQKRRMEMNLCRNCGYDLRATTTQCPECGTAVGVAAPRE